MLIKCTCSCGEQLSTGQTYLVIEVYANFLTKVVSYRIIDNDGVPAIYPSRYFEIISNAVDGFGLSVKEDVLLLSPVAIISSKLNEENIDGFWGCYYEDSRKWVQAKETLQLALAEISAKENLDLLHIPAIAEQWEDKGEKDWGTVHLS